MNLLDKITRPFSTFFSASIKSENGLNRRLWWGCWLLVFVGLAFVLITKSQVWTGQLNDSDDYMRLARVRDLLNGQGWYDLAQPRLSPGENFMLPWSRFIDLPLAAVTLLFTPLIGQMAASGVAAFLVPLLWLLAFCLVLPHLARGFFPHRRAWLLLLVLLCSFAALRELRPMRVDHHGAQLMFALCGLVTLQLYLLRPAWRLRFLTGLSAAAGLAIGAESFLWVCLAITYLALQDAWRGGEERRDALAFAAGLLGGLLLALPLLRPPADWFAHDLALPALPHLLLAFLTGAVLLALTRFPAHTRWRGLLLLTLCAMPAFALLLTALPELRNGLYAANMTEANQSLILGAVIEAKSYWQRLDGISAETLKRYWPLIAHNLVIPALSLLISGLQLYRTRHAPRRFSLWLLQAWFLLPVMALGLLWQSRAGIYLALYALLPMAWLLAQALSACARYITWRWPCRLTQLVLLLPLPLLTVVSAALLQGARPAQAFFFPSWFVARPCDFKTVAELLNDPQLFPPPLNLMTSMSGGAELLYRTDHRVFAAPYDVGGNALAMQFFGNRDLGAAYQLARMHHIDLVLMCDGYAGYYLPDAAARAAAGSAEPYLERGLPVPPEVTADRVLVDYLLTGDAPDWLKPVPLPDPKLHLFRVDRHE